MEITRVIYSKQVGRKAKPLAVCSVILDDCLKLNNIKLFQGDSGYYLVLPSKQDVYKEIQEQNEGVQISYPVKIAGENELKKYDEYFHPVDYTFYKKLLDAVVEGYLNYKGKGIESYRP